MKKMFKTLCAIIIFSLALQFIINLLIKKHKINYTLISDNNNYNIIEKYNKYGYYFSITDKYKHKINIYDDINFNKQEKIIKNIYYYQSDDLNCFLPVYIHKKTGNIQCILNNEQVSSSYLKQINNISFKNIVNKIKDDNFNILIDKKNTLKNENGILVNRSDYPSDLIYTVWNYKGIYIFNEKEVINKQLFDSDVYENINSRLVGKYYVTFDNDSSSNYSYSKIIAYNIIDSGFKNIEVDTFSKNSYVNGVFENKYYFTDLDKKIQYVVDPYKGTFNKVDGYRTVVNGKLVNVSKSDFFTGEIAFSDYFENNKINYKYNGSLIYYDKNIYYFLYNNSIYEIINKDYDHPIKIASFDKISNFTEREGVISFINDNIIYTYTDKNGLIPVIKNDEFKYNNKNIYDFLNI